MPEPAFDTLEAARRLKSAGIEVEHAEAIVEVMGQSVNQLVTREHFSAELGLTREHFDSKLRVTREHFDSKLRVTREHFDTELQLTREQFGAGIVKLGTELHARIDGVESKVQSLESTVRAEMHAQTMRAVLIVVGILIPAIGLMLAFVQFYSARGGGA
ncbi:MAG: hypothetical protein OXQ29_13585 [Rhodospirillaceae bacterium]|nr:hypothetical protein [Rhodospirillaceae bacterium]